MYYAHCAGTLYTLNLSPVPFICFIWTVGILVQCKSSCYSLGFTKMKSYTFICICTSMSWRMLVNVWRYVITLFKFLVFSALFTLTIVSLSSTKYSSLNKELCSWYFIAIAVVNTLHVKLNCCRARCTVFRLVLCSVGRTTTFLY